MNLISTGVLNTTGMKIKGKKSTVGERLLCLETDLQELKAHNETFKQRFKESAESDNARRINSETYVSANPETC